MCDIRHRITMQDYGYILISHFVVVCALLYSSSAQYCPSADKRIYTFAFSNDGFPANYVENGKLTGQAVDMVKEICRFAGKKCKTSVVPRKACWDTSEGFPPVSIALNQHWCDSCANLPPSDKRVLSYEFADNNYYRTMEPMVIVTTNSNITIADLKTCNDFSLAYPADTALEPDCLLDLGMFVKPDHYVPVRNTGRFDLITITDTLEKMVRDGEVEMALVVTVFAKFNGVKPLTSLSCGNQVPLGLNTMFRQNDEDIKEWFSKYLHKYMCEGDQYANFCKQMQNKYGPDPLCRVPGDDLDCTKFGGPAAKNTSLVANRIFPCDNQCIILEKGQTWYIFKDQFEDPATKALRGASKTYSGQINTDVIFIINTINSQRFTVKTLCVTTKRARAVTFVFRGGLREAEETVVPIFDFDNFITTCVDSENSWNLLNIKIDVRKVSGQEIRIKLRDLWMEGCMMD